VGEARVDGAEHSSRAQTRDGSRGKSSVYRCQNTCANLTRNAEVEKGRAAAREGRLLDHDEVAARMDLRYRG
jgi:hypothetical protein